MYTFSFTFPRCVVEGCDGANPEFAPSWILNAINGTSMSSFDNCEKFVRNSSSEQQITAGTCPATFFDQTATRQCDDYVYENQLSVVYDVSLMLFIRFF